MLEKQYGPGMVQLFLLQFFSTYLYILIDTSAMKPLNLL